MKTKNQNSITAFSGDNKFLSNFYSVEVELDGVIYMSVEHAYQAAKTLDTEERKPFHKHPLPTAGESKKLGRKLTIRPDWESVKLQVMKDLLVQKFAIPELKEMLAETKGKTLVEGNYWNDFYWGVCKGKGENHLGKLLMEIRDK
jgi:ribA/ribD-fused uncharacterized protein